METIFNIEALPDNSVFLFTANYFSCALHKWFVPRNES